MDPEIEKRFEKTDESLRQIERQVLATANFVRKVGMPSLIEAQMRIDALMDSDTRLYGALQELAERQIGLIDSHKGLAEAQKKTDEQIEQLATSQKKTDDQIEELAASQKKTAGQLDQLAASQKKTDAQLDRLAASVQAFIDSLRKNGNGSKP